MERKSKAIFQLGSPFTRTQVSEISSEHQEIILELLCSVLSPIGVHRLTVPASKGKRSKKRKRQDAKLKGETPETTRSPTPEISSSVLVGMSSVTRGLEELSENSKPTIKGFESTDREDTLGESKGAAESSVEVKQKACGSHFSAIFVLSQSLPSVLQYHLPQLVATASLAHPTLPATRLVQLPKGCEARICSALGLQRVSIIGILDGAPHTQSLMDLVRNCVPEVQIRWLQEVKKHEYLPVKVNAIETFGWVSEKEAQRS